MDIDRPDLQCPGRLEEPERHAFNCSRGIACLCDSIRREFQRTGDENVAQRLRDCHTDRGAPTWLTVEEN